MGCLFVLILGGVSAAMIFFFGYPDWLLIVLGLLWLASLVVTALQGHMGFGGHGNTDLQIVIAGLFITAALVVPNYTNQKNCAQPKTALNELAKSEAAYFALHKTYTDDLSLLNLTPDPNIQVKVIKADEKSFTASASHRLCTNKQDRTPVEFTWDSSHGLQ
jgi:hypothetical protein